MEETVRGETLCGVALINISSMEDDTESPLLIETRLPVSMRHRSYDLVSCDALFWLAGIIRSGSFDSQHFVFRISTVIMLCGGTGSVNDADDNVKQLCSTVRKVLSIVKTLEFILLLYFNSQTFRCIVWTSHTCLDLKNGHSQFSKICFSLDLIHRVKSRSTSFALQMCKRSIALTAITNITS